MRQAARLDHVHLHDLRHVFASAAVGMGYSLVQIGGVLGHSETATTATYGYLLDDPRKIIAEDVARGLAAMMEKGRERAPV